MDNWPAQFRKLIELHEQWLSPWPDHLHKWKTGLKADLEAAVAEARVCQRLRQQLYSIGPSDIPRIGGVDYRCVPFSERERFFYLEVTNLESDALTKKSGLPARVDDWKGGGVHVRPIQRAFLGKRQDKEEQVTKCAANQIPVVIAITTSHDTATLCHFDKKGAERILIPPERCDKESEEIYPSFQNSLFFRPDSASRLYEMSCPEIAGVLLCTSWEDAVTEEPMITLVMNPTACYPFDPAWLPDIPCCKLQRGWERAHPLEWKVEWMNDQTAE